MKGTNTFSSVYPTLHLFIDKVAELENSRFMESISQKFSLDININTEFNNPISVASSRPDQDNINGFSLPFRFFIQKRDGISIIENYNKPLQDIFDSDLVTNQEREDFQDIIRNANGFLLENSGITIYDENITNGILMEVFMYGRLSHTNEDKKQKFDLWMSREDAREFLWHKFCITVIAVLYAIQRIRDMFEIIITRHQNNIGISHGQTKV